MKRAGLRGAAGKQRCKVVKYKKSANEWKEKVSLALYSTVARGRRGT